MPDTFHGCTDVSVRDLYLWSSSLLLHLSPEGIAVRWLFLSQVHPPDSGRLLQNMNDSSVSWVCGGRHTNTPCVGAKNSKSRDPVNSGFKTDTFFTPWWGYKLCYLVSQAGVELKLIKWNFPWAWELGPGCARSSSWLQRQSRVLGGASVLSHTALHS